MGLCALFDKHSTRIMIMSFSPLGGTTPQQTPDVIKKLILVTCIASIVCGLFDSILGPIFDESSLRALLSLSREGFQNRYLWQIVTYLFIQDTGGVGFSTFFFLSLAFNMYILWAMGSSIVEYVGAKSFLQFYILTGIFAGLAILMTMNYSHAGRLLSMLYPEMELLVFFLFPIKAKGLALIVFGIEVLIPLSRLDVLYLTFNTVGILFGYIYAAMAWNLESPFAITHPLDRRLHRWGRFLIKGGSAALQSTKTLGKQAKIFDFKTGEPVLKDDEFVDAMLAKISKKGESSLSFN
jgi:membrane associated rhomboid family serine protease